MQFSWLNGWATQVDAAVPHRSSRKTEQVNEIRRTPQKHRQNHLLKLASCGQSEKGAVVAKSLAPLPCPRLRARRRRPRHVPEGHQPGSARRTAPTWIWQGLVYGFPGRMRQKITRSIRRQRLCVGASLLNTFALPKASQTGRPPLRWRKVHVCVVKKMRVRAN